MSASVLPLLRSAATQIERNQFDAAAITLESALLLAPQHVPARLLAVNAYLRLDQPRAAHAHALQAAQTKPPDAGSELDLFNRLRGFNEFSLMIASGERLLAHKGLTPVQCMQVASGLSAIGAAELANAMGERMRVQAPKHPATLLTLGSLATHRGDFDAAETALEQGIKVEPRLAMAHWLLARLRTQTRDRHHIARLTQLVADPVLTPTDNALAGFALHKELHDVGDHALAWRALERACAVKRRNNGYDEAGTMALFDALHAQPRPKEPPVASAPMPGPVPIFIVGMHRSGTTLLERILGRHAMVQDCGETYRFTAQWRLAANHHCRGVVDAGIIALTGKLDHARVGAAFLAACRERLAPEVTHFTEKLPSNFLAIDLIKRALPHARILHMQRDPMDTCLSNLRELFSDACAYSYDQGELARYYLRYARLMQHWHQVYPDQILDVRYEDLVADPQAQARRVLAYCGLPWRDACVDDNAVAGVVTTASSVQVRAPIHARSVGGWRSYETQLEPMRAILSSARDRGID